MWEGEKLSKLPGLWVLPAEHGIPSLVLGWAFTAASSDCLGWGMWLCPWAAVPALWHPGAAAGNRRCRAACGLWPACWRGPSGELPWVECEGVRVRTPRKPPPASSKCLLPQALFHKLQSEVQREQMLPSLSRWDRVCLNWDVYVLSCKIQAPLIFLMLLDLWISQIDD